MRERSRNEKTLKDKLTKNDVLALDIATHTGFFSLHGRGTWNFTESMKRNSNKQHKAFRETLIDFIKQHDIKMIVAEDVSVGKSFVAARKLSEFRGILLEVCDTLNLPEPAFVNPMTLKKFATKNGKASKADMIDFCRSRWHSNPIDDNEADATHIFMYYVKTFNLI